MVEKGTVILGEEPAPREIEEIDELKIAIVEQLRDAQVQFPIKDKAQLSNIYPRGTRKSCIFRGKVVSLHDLIPLLDNSDFPINSAGDAATVLLSKCDLPPASE